jgi:nitrate reductase NapE component
MSWTVVLNMGVLAAGASLTASDRMRSKIIFQVCVVGIVAVASIVLIGSYGFLGASYTICIMWGSLVTFYLPYVSFKGLVSPSSLFRFSIPSVLTIVIAVYLVNFFTASVTITIASFFLCIILIWLLTFFWIKK